MVDTKGITHGYVESCAPTKESVFTGFTKDQLRISRDRLITYENNLFRYKSSIKYGTEFKLGQFNRFTEYHRNNHNIEYIQQKYRRSVKERNKISFRSKLKLPINRNIKKGIEVKKPIKRGNRDSAINKTKKLLSSSFFKNSTPVLVSRRARKVKPNSRYIDLVKNYDAKPTLPLIPPLRISKSLFTVNRPSIPISAHHSPPHSSNHYNTHGPILLSSDQSSTSGSGSSLFSDVSLSLAVSPVSETFDSPQPTLPAFPGLRPDRSFGRMSAYSDSDSSSYDVPLAFTRRKLYAEDERLTLPDEATLIDYVEQTHGKRAARLRKRVKPPPPPVEKPPPKGKQKVGRPRGKCRRRRRRYLANVEASGSADPNAATSSTAPVEPKVTPTTTTLSSPNSPAIVRGSNRESTPAAINPSAAVTATPSTRSATKPRPPRIHIHSSYRSQGNIISSPDGSPLPSPLVLIEKSTPRQLKLAGVFAEHEELDPQVVAGLREESELPYFHRPLIVVGKRVRKSNKWFDKDDEYESPAHAGEQGKTCLTTPKDTKTKVSPCHLGTISKPVADLATTTTTTPLRVATETSTADPSLMKYRSLSVYGRVQLQSTLDADMLNGYLKLCLRDSLFDTSIRSMLVASGFEVDTVEQASIHDRLEIDDPMFGKCYICHIFIVKKLTIRRFHRICSTCNTFWKRRIFGKGGQHLKCFAPNGRCKTDATVAPSDRCRYCRFATVASALPAHHSNLSDDYRNQIDAVVLSVIRELSKPTPVGDPLLDPVDNNLTSDRVIDMGFNTLILNACQAAEEEDKPLANLVVGESPIEAVQELLSPEREKTTMTTIIQDIGDKAEDEQGNHVEELSSGELFDEEMFVDEIDDSTSSCSDSEPSDSDSCYIFDYMRNISIQALDIFPPLDKEVADKVHKYHRINYVCRRESAIPNSARSVKRDVPGRPSTRHHTTSPLTSGQLEDAGPIKDGVNDDTNTRSSSGSSSDET